MIPAGANTIFGMHVWRGNAVEAFLASTALAIYGLAVCMIERTASVLACLIQLRILPVGTVKPAWFNRLEQRGTRTTRHLPNTPNGKAASIIFSMQRSRHPPSDAMERHGVRRSGCDPSTHIMRGELKLVIRNYGRQWFADIEPDYGPLKRKANRARCKTEPITGKSHRD